jgi:hypothetical protein
MLVVAAASPDGAPASDTYATATDGAPPTHADISHPYKCTRTGIPQLLCAADPHPAKFRESGERPFARSLLASRVYTSTPRVMHLYIKTFTYTHIHTICGHYPRITMESPIVALASFPPLRRIGIRMDPPIVAFASLHFRDCQRYNVVESGTVYISGLVNQKRVTISKNAAYIITISGAYALAGGTCREVMGILDCILHDRVFKISELTRQTSGMTGIPIYTECSANKSQ